MAAKALHTPEEMRKLFRLDCDTGKLFWMFREDDGFSDGRHASGHIAKRWNARFAGKEAFTARNDFGYAVTSIGGRVYRAHRVIWAIVHDAWPDGDVDHINGVPDDNRLCNLRAVTHRVNLRNQKRRTSNTSGVTGVGWYKAYGKWRAHITLDGKMQCLGYFDKIEDAIAARAAADSKYDYHANHGRMA